MIFLSPQSAPGQERRKHPERIRTETRDSLPYSAIVGGQAYQDRLTSRFSRIDW